MAGGELRFSTGLFSLRRFVDQSQSESTSLLVQIGAGLLKLLQPSCRDRFRDRILVLLRSEIKRRMPRISSPSAGPARKDLTLNQETQNVILGRYLVTSRNSG